MNNSGNGKVILLAPILIISLILYIPVVIAPPQPHNVEGRVFQSDGETGAENDIPVRINNTANGDSVLSSVHAPPIPEISGSYSSTINGSDNDIIVTVSWNSTHYGKNTTTLSSTTTNLNVVINKTRNGEPNVTIINPVNNTMKNTSHSFNVISNISIIGGADALNCNATIYISDNSVLGLVDGENLTHTLGNIALGSSTLSLWNLTGIKDGSANISVGAVCDSNEIDFEGVHSYTVYNLTILDTTPPVVSLRLPFNNSWVPLQNITFNYNVSDSGGIKNCSIYLDNALYMSNTSVLTGIVQNFTINNIAEGNHTWYITCYDNSGLNNYGNSTTWNFSSDSTPPLTSLISPDNNSIILNNTVLFKYNVTDTFGVMNCSLILDESILQTNLTVEKNITQNFSIFLRAGIHNWSINCTDNAGNTGTSDTWQINITDADLMISSSNILFSVDPTTEGINITINATILNIGNENATNVVIKFFENTTEALTQLDTDKVVNITANDNVSVFTSYITKVGTVSIHVVVDTPLATNGSISEFNESNNIANRTIFISAYNLYYGKVNAQVILDSASNISVYTWFNATDVAGNIMVADTDSLIEWSSLLPLGRNLSDALAIEDFAELDTALNFTNLTDSVNLTYTLDSMPLNTESFRVFGFDVNNVPVTNSTNSTNFVTGIMWDSSDQNLGNFNGTQDVVFVTKINRYTQGKYGVYDYEIKVPSNLKKYINPNNQNTITFYVELK